MMFYPVFISPQHFTGPALESDRHIGPGPAAGNGPCPAYFFLDLVRDGPIC